MKLVLAFLGLIAVVLPQTTPDANNLTGSSLADYVNTVQDLWVAVEKSLTLVQMKVMTMKEQYLVPISDITAPIASIPDSAIPASFDARQQWPACLSIKNIRDQSYCGSCWAVAAAEAISDRICIASNGLEQPVISADDILSCCGPQCGYGCNGGFPIEAWKWWVNQGVCTGGSYQYKTGCKPYPFAPCGQHANQPYYGPCPASEYNTPQCENTCQSGYPIRYQNDKYFGKSAYGVANTVTAIQKELMINGPVEATFTVYEDFYYYSSGIYKHTGGKLVGAHAIKIIGWGVDNSTSYWLAANSWNTDWGENGFFRIIRGIDDCGIEDGVVAGIPNVLL